MPIAPISSSKYMTNKFMPFSVQLWLCTGVVFLNVWLYNIAIEVNIAMHGTCSRISVACELVAQTNLHGLTMAHMQNGPILPPIK